MAISPQSLDRFWWNLARWRTLTPLSAPTVKIRIFENPRWRRPPSWKSQKSRYLRNGLTDLYEIWYDDSKMGLSTAPTVKNLNFQNPRWRTAAVLKTVKSPYLCNFLTDYHEIRHSNAYWSPAPCNFRQSYVSENRYLENRKTCLNICCNCTITHYTILTIKQQTLILKTAVYPPY